MKQVRGFTIVELMVTLGIMAIVFAMAIPSFEGMVKRNMVQKVRDDLYSDLVLARSEAMARNRQVTVCASANASAAAPVCSTGATDWNTGWIVFSDTDGDRVQDKNVTNIPDDELIRVYTNANQGDMQLKFSSALAQQNLTFDRLGRMSNGANGTFWFCQTQIDYTAAIVVNGVGRAYNADGDATQC